MESENLEVVISDTGIERLRVSKFFLVGKVLSHKYLRPNIVMGVIQDLWCPKASVEATTIGDNCIVFSFNSEEEVQVVLKGSPWFFGKFFLQFPLMFHYRSNVFRSVFMGSLRRLCRGR